MSNNPYASTSAEQQEPRRGKLFAFVDCRSVSLATAGCVVVLRDSDAIPELLRLERFNYKLKMIANDETNIFGAKLAGYS